MEAVTALVDTHGNNLLAVSLVGTAAVVSTMPIKGRLMTANGSATAAGTEVVGGSYASQTLTFSAPAGQSTANTNAANYTTMPTCVVVGLELWDSAGTPARKQFGPLNTPKTLNSGDTFTFAIGAVTSSFT